MGIEKWIQKNVEVRYPFETEPTDDSDQERKPVRLRIGGVFVRRVHGWHVPKDGGIRMLKGMVGGAIVLFFIAVIAAIVDGILRLN